jgi:hypothetical protein
MASSSSDGQLSGVLTIVGIGAIVLGTMIGAYLATKALELVVRMVVHHHDNVFIRVAVCLCLVLTAAAAVTRFGYPILNGLAGFSYVVLLLVCKGVELYYEPYFLPETDRGTLVDEVLHDPWWNTDALAA